MLGQLTESDANRRLSASQTNASLATQASLANAAAANQRGMFNAGLQTDTGRFNANLGQNADLANAQALLQRQGMGLDFLGQQRGLDLTQAGINNAAQNDAFARQMHGATMLQNASQIPLANMQALYNAGLIQQQDAQAQRDADLARWNFEQQAPWANLAALQAAVGPFAQLGSGETGQRSGTSTTEERTGGLGPALGNVIGLGSMFLPGAGLGGLFAGAAGSGIGRM